MTDFSSHRDQAELHGTRITALVIESDVILQQFLRRTLERHGIGSRVAATPEQGEQVARDDTAIDVVLCGAATASAAPEVIQRLVGSQGGLPVVTYGGLAAPRPKAGRRAGALAPSSTGAGPLDAEVLVQSILAAVRRGTPGRTSTQPIRRSS